MGRPSCFHIQWPGTRVILFTAYDSDFERVSPQEAGAAGYLLKAQDEHKLAEAVMETYPGLAA